MMDVISAGSGRQIFQIVCIGIFFVSLALAAQRMRVAWLIADITGFAYAFRNITTGRWFSNRNNGTHHGVASPQASDAKLCVVAIVVTLGAWNWRRMAPQLGNEESAMAITRSATAELSFAAVVLAITALLVSLPSPGPSGPPGAGRPPGAGGEPGRSGAPTPGAGITIISSAHSASQVMSDALPSNDRPSSRITFRSCRGQPS